MPIAVTYREELPASCPPAAADEIVERRDVFRLVRTDPPTENDFVCRLRLDTGAGELLQTGQRSHHTWWPFASYDLLAVATVESP